MFIFFNSIRSNITFSILKSYTTAVNQFTSRQSCCSSFATEMKNTSEINTEKIGLAVGGIGLKVGEQKEKIEAAEQSNKYLIQKKSQQNDNLALVGEQLNVL